MLLRYLKAARGAAAAPMGPSDSESDSSHASHAAPEVAAPIAEDEANPVLRALPPVPNVTAETTQPPSRVLKF